MREKRRVVLQILEIVPCYPYIAPTINEKGRYRYLLRVDVLEHDGAGKVVCKPFASSVVALVHEHRLIDNVIDNVMPDLMPNHI